MKERKENEEMIEPQNERKTKAVKQAMWVFFWTDKQISFENAGL